MLTFYAVSLTQLQCISGTSHCILFTERKQSLLKYRYNIFIAVKDISESPCSVWSETACIFDSISELRPWILKQELFVVMYPTTF